MAQYNASTDSELEEKIYEIYQQVADHLACIIPDCKCYLSQNGFNLYDKAQSLMQSYMEERKAV